MVGRALELEGTHETPAGPGGKPALDECQEPSANCTATRNLTGALATRSLISSKRKFGLRAAASVSLRYSLPAAGGTR